MKSHEWETPKAMAIPKETDHLEQGKYGPIFPKTPACYGFSCIAKVIPGKEQHLYNHAKVIEKAIGEPGHAGSTQGTLLEMGDLHY